jgi:hypothetical protein
MRKLLWRKSQMSRSAFLDEAVGWSRDLTHMRSRGPGDIENAMRSIEREYGVDYQTLWRLRYKAPSLKDIGVTAYMRLKAAYQAECDRQLRKLKNDIALTKASTSSDLVDEASSFLRSHGG